MQRALKLQVSSCKSIGIKLSATCALIQEFPFELILLFLRALAPFGYFRTHAGYFNNSYAGHVKRLYKCDGSRMAQASCH